MVWMNKDLPLFNVLKQSYGEPKQSKKSMRENYGYYLDKKLSNHNQQVYYKPDEKRLLVSVAGTHNLSDWGTNLALATGNLKSTNRYQEADSILREAKKKYNPTNTTVAGHSLGSTIGQGIASKSGGDKFIGLDAGYTIGQKTHSSNGNFQHFRSKGDIVSLLGANAKHMKTLQNQPTQNPIRAHNVENIKNEKIYV